MPSQIDNLKEMLDSASIFYIEASSALDTKVVKIDRLYFYFDKSGKMVNIEHRLENVFRQ